MNTYYIARDEDGDLKLFNEMPERREYENGQSIWVGWNIRLKNNDLFKDLDWCNNPMKVTLNIQEYNGNMEEIKDSPVEEHEDQVEPEENGDNQKQG